MAKTYASAVAAIVDRKPIWQLADLVDAGLSLRQIRYLQQSDRLVKLAQGVFGTPEADLDPNVQYAVACLSTGGILCCRTAGFRHGLTDDMPDRIEVMMPHGTGRDRSTQPVRIIQSRNPMSFTEGVETETVLGVEVRMTDRPRTVIDLVRGPVRQHAVAAVHAYLAQGGSGDDLDKMARHFGQTVQEEVSLLTEGTLQAMSRSYGA